MHRRLCAHDVLLLSELLRRHWYKLDLGLLVGLRWPLLVGIVHGNGTSSHWHELAGWDWSTHDLQRGSRQRVRVHGRRLATGSRRLRGSARELVLQGWAGAICRRRASDHLRLRRHAGLWWGILRCHLQRRRSRRHASLILSLLKTVRASLRLLSLQRGIHHSLDRPSRHAGSLRQALSLRHSLGHGHPLHRWTGHSAPRSRLAVVGLLLLKLRRHLRGPHGHLTRERLRGGWSLPWGRLTGN